MEHGGHEFTEDGFPFWAVGLDTESVFFKSTVVGHFVDVGDQELVGVEVVVDRYFLDASVPAVSEIPQFTLSFLGDMQVERLCFP